MPLRDTSHSGDAFEWQGDWNGAWQGCDFRERHMLSRWILCDSPHEGQLGQTGRQWTMVRTVCLHLRSCLSGRMFSIFTVCAVVRLKGHLISQPAEPCHLGNRNAHGRGLTRHHPLETGAVITSRHGLAVYLLLWWLTQVCVCVCEFSPCL